MKITDKITITNEDNMELMARYPDNYFDLAIVDPPYGIKDSKRIRNDNKGRGLNRWKNKSNIEWDNKPTDNYWNELFRIFSKCFYLTTSIYPIRRVNNCQIEILIWIT